MCDLRLEEPHVPIVCEHEDFLVVHKPPDYAVTRDAENDGVLTLLRRRTGWTGLIPVHRLDKVTSGLWLLAKNPEAARVLTALFREHTIRKCYLALSDRKPHKKQGVIIGDMARTRNGQWKISLSRKAPAITRFVSRSIAPGLRLFALFPETGKTHQVRVAMKCLGSPILGDPLYANAKSRFQNVDRTYLHAYALAFSYKGIHYHFKELPQHGRLFLEPIFLQGLNSFKSLGEDFSRPWRP
ncbi:MAG: TIGR01621 family pseudouridine synthase [Desulfosoma sp.]